MVGCATFEASKSPRSANQQYVMSHAIDKTIDKYSFYDLQGKHIKVSVVSMQNVEDTEYLKESLRRAVSKSGAILDETSYLNLVASVGTLGDNTKLSAVGTTNVLSTDPSYYDAPTGHRVAFTPVFDVYRFVQKNGYCVMNVTLYDSGRVVKMYGDKSGQSMSINKWYLNIGPFESGPDSIPTTKP